MAEHDLEMGGRLSPVAADGTIRVPAFDLPPPQTLSDEGRQALIAGLTRGSDGGRRLDSPSFEGIADEAAFVAYVDAYRREVDELLARPASEAAAARFPVELEEAVIGGVPVEDVRGPDADDTFVLINLHGGGFVAGAKYMARLESIPIAHLGGLRVVSVDYRQAHEHRFPAASEDLASVYQGLLGEYPPSRIGIFGGSAGAMLTAASIPWFIEHGLPVPGAIGVFSGSGGGPPGDSKYFSAIATGSPAPPVDLDPTGDRLLREPFTYFSAVAPDDPLAFPIYAAPEVHAQYPPTLLVTGTRAWDLSPTVAFHRVLVRAKVDAFLHVFDGVGHCFYYGARTPEALDAHDTMVRFFQGYLTR